MRRRWLVPMVIVMALLAPHAPARAIIGGKGAPWGAYPFMAAVLSDGFFTCSGTVIAPRWVLTAGHCVGAGQYSVVVGSNNYSNGSGRTIAVDAALRHPNYQSNFINDVGLLHLVSNANVPLVRLSGAGDNDLEAQGTQTTLVGWGDRTPTLGLLAPAQLKHAQQKVVSDINCFGETSSLNAQTTVCSKGLAKGQCNGDSGGPLLGYKYGTWVEIGVVSNSFPLLCGSVSVVWPAELAEVNASSIRQWIASTTGV